MRTCSRNPLASQFLRIFGHSLKVGVILALPVIATLLTGMVVHGTASARAAQGNLVTGTSLADYYRQLHRIAPQLPQIHEQILASVQRNRKLRMRTDGFLVLDEHIIPHASKGIEGVDSYYSPSERKVVLGHSLIMAHYFRGRVEYPVAGDYYRRERELTARGQEWKFRKKNAIAREMFKKFAKDPHAPHTWLLDRYFMTKDNGQLIEKLGRYFISRPKKNWNCTYNRRKTDIASLYDTIRKKEFAVVVVRSPKTHKVRRYYAAIRDVWVRKLGMVRVVFVDGSRLPPDPGAEHADAEVDESPGEKKFRAFITNHVDWDAGRVLCAYAIRWTIETCFRDLIQHLGLHTCQWRDIACQQGFVAASFLCYLFLAWLKVSGEIAAGGGGRETIGDLRENFSRYCQDLYAKHLRTLRPIEDPGGPGAWVYDHLLGGRGYSA